MTLTKCFMPVTHKGRTALFHVDLLLEPGQPPVAVLEWSDYPDGTRIPSVAVQLDPRYLHEVPGQGEATHSYERPIDSPIPVR